MPVSRRRAVIISVFSAIAPAAALAPVLAAPGIAITGDQMVPLWAAFSGPMNEYVDGLNHGLNRQDKLRSALRAWSRMYDAMGWRQIK